ncbi:MAG TPA: VIT domain-containing protein, partial [Minicystis sp.]|nr:VIT domain-containing protein [Minicystis sp.]
MRPARPVRSGLALRALALALLLAPAVACSGAAPPAALPPTPPGAAAARAPQATFTALGSKAVLAVAMRYPVEKVVEAPPLSLTASDGTGLRLTSLDARAVVEGPLAFTELHLAFENPLDRVLEGRFAVTLPPGATVSRLAMKTADGKWQEAEVVEKQAARVAYEDALHHRQDPALLEREAGNEVRARVFPIPARATKEIIVSYSQEIAAGRRYRLPLRGLPEVARLRVTADVAGKRATLERSAYRPDQDFEAALPAGAPGLRSDDVALVRVRPDLGAEQAPTRELVLLFDTSASRALGFSREVARLGELVAALAKGGAAGAHLVVAAFDQTVEPIYEGPIAGFSQRELDALLARRPLGASDLAGAVAWLGTARPGARAVLVTDAVTTTGSSDAAIAAARGLRGKIARLDVLLAGGIRDDEAARRLARGALEQDGVVLDAAGDVAETARRLALTTRSGITVDVASASWVWPERLDGMQPGDEAIVYALLKKGAVPADALHVTLGGSIAQELDVRTAPADKPLVERAAAN